MLPAYTLKAQALGPNKGWGYGEKLRVCGLTDAACGLPTTAVGDRALRSRFTIADAFLIVFYRWGGVVGVDVAHYVC